MTPLLFISLAIGLLITASVGWAALQALRAVRRVTVGLVIAFDETVNCSKCGCGMVDDARVWRCPECHNLVEAE